MAFVMLDYTGVKCPVCGVPFGKDDDIVVCPECGAPYHRACYSKEGKCIFTDLHQQGKEWEPPAPPKAPDPAAEIKDRECPRCGSLNGHSALFCSRCGASLLGEPQTYSNTGNPAGQAGQRNIPPYPTWNSGAYGAAPFSFDPMGGVSPAEALDEGVTFGDASKLVKQNTGYYMPVFRYIKQTGRNKFNFSAFLFSGIWLLYRKQYKRGIIVTVLTFSLYLAAIFTSLFLSTPILQEMAKQIGADISQGLTTAQIMEISQLLAADLSAYFQMILPTLCLLAVLPIRISVGILGNKLYLEHCVRTVRQARAQNPGGDPAMALEERGGVNNGLAICLGVCYFLVILPLLI